MEMGRTLNPEGRKEHIVITHVWKLNCELCKTHEENKTRKNNGNIHVELGTDFLTSHELIKRTIDGVQGLAKLKID